MSAILGLLGTEQLANFRFKNVRRSVFYDYPNGAAPLTGLLSLQEEESTNDPEFSWWEKRLKEQRTTTASQGSSKGPFLTAAGSDLTDSQNLVAQTQYQVVVASSAQFRVSHVIRIPVDLASATGSDTIIGLITAIVDSTHIKFKALKAITSLDNGTTNENVGKEVLVIGSAAEQGQVGAGLAVYNTPVNPGNYCQIFRTPWQITGTNLKTSAKYDETGAYKDQAKEASLDHMRGMEFACLFGEKTVNVDGTTNQPTYTTGGILYFLGLWEAGSVYENTAATADSDDNKRIIANSTGVITEKQYDEYCERVFRVTNNKANEKLVLCGSGFLSTLNRMFKGRSVLEGMPTKDVYGMNVVRHVTPFGTLYYKTHPLFTQNATLRFNAMFVEVGNMKYRYMDGRDTEILTERQPNNADYREDEWLTEAGFEIRKPESFMYMQNVRDWAP